MILDLSRETRNAATQARMTFVHPAARKLFFAAVLLLGIANMSTALQFYRASSRIAEAEKRLAAVVAERTAKEKEIAALRMKLAGHWNGVKFMQEGASMYEFAAAVSGTAKGSIRLLRLEGGEKQVTLTGEAVSESAVMEFVERLEHLVCVTAVGLPELYDAEDSAQHAGRRFTLRCTLR